MPHLRLKSRVAMIPVGARLNDRKFIDEGLVWPDARKPHARHTVELKGHQQAVPGVRGVLIQMVGQGETHLLARTDEHTFDLPSLMRISTAVFCLQNTKHLHSAP